MDVLGKIAERSKNPMAIFNKLDEAGIYGDRIWDLHRHVASQDYEKTFKLLLYLVNDRVSAEALTSAINSKKPWQGEL
jgi:hypothetical protein